MNPVRNLQHTVSNLVLALVKRQIIYDNKFAEEF